MKRKDYLVYLKNGVNSLPTELVTDFKEHSHFRCIELSDNNQTQMLVNGVVFNKTYFDKYFGFVLDRAIKHFKHIGLIVNDKPVSKTKFNTLADVHTYGRGRKNIKVVYFHGFDTDRITYGFYNAFIGETKKQTLANAYRMFIDFINGESNDFDMKLIQYGNCGIPIAYGNLRQTFRQPTKEIL